MIYKVYDPNFNEIFSSSYKEEAIDCVILWEKHQKLVININTHHQKSILSQEFDYPLSVWEFQLDPKNLDCFNVVKVR